MIGKLKYNSTCKDFALVQSLLYSVQLFDYLFYYFFITEIDRVTANLKNIRTNNFFKDFY